MLLAGAALSTAGIAAGQEEIVRRGRVGRDGLIQSALPKDATLLKKAVEVNLGDRRTGIMALYRASATDTLFSGLVLMPEAGSDFRVTALPPPRGINGFWELDVEAVFTMLSNSRFRALIILYRAQRLGSDEAPVRAGYVYVWGDKGWQIDESRTSSFVGIANVAAVRTRLTGKR